MLSFIVIRGFGSQTSVTVTNVPIGSVSSQRNVTFAGTFDKTGTLLSPTFTSCVAVAELPQASVAVHVLTNLYEPTHAPFSRTSLNVNLGLASQRSDTEGFVTVGTVPPQLTVIFVGTLVNVGAALSPTEIVCVAVAELPHASVAVHVLITV